MLKNARGISSREEDREATAFVGSACCALLVVEHSRLRDVVSNELTPLHQKRIRVVRNLKRTAFGKRIRFHPEESATCDGEERSSRDASRDDGRVRVNEAENGSFRGRGGPCQRLVGSHVGAFRPLSYIGVFSLISALKADPLIGRSRLLHVPSNVRNLEHVNGPRVRCTVPDLLNEPEMIAEIFVAVRCHLSGSTVEVCVAVSDIIYGECLAMRCVCNCSFLTVLQRKPNKHEVNRASPSCVVTKVQSSMRNPPSLREPPPGPIVLPESEHVLQKCINESLKKL